MSVDPSNSSARRSSARTATSSTRCRGTGRQARFPAKKADIVDLILELAGVTPQATAAVGNGSRERCRGAPDATRPKDDEATESADDRRGRGRPTSSPSTDEGPRPRRPRPRRPQARGGRRPTTEPPSGASADGASRVRQRTAQAEPSVRPTAAARQRRAAAPAIASRATGGRPATGRARATSSRATAAIRTAGNQQGGQSGDPEPGNRRRRRRGRDRDRDDAQPQEDQQQWQGEPVDVEGLLDLRDEGYGFLRVKGYLPSKDDVYVSVKQVRQFGLRKGDHVKGASRPAGRNEKNPALLRIDLVNGVDPEQARKPAPRFEDLTPLFPDEKLRLERRDRHART